MPFTPFHLGPGIAVKAMLQRRFSIVVFSWSQIIIDLQPLYVILTGHGKYHGYSHTYLGATLLTLVATVIGKYLGELGFRLVGKPEYLPIRWPVAFVSAFIGCFSHVFIDSVTHKDVSPFAPFSYINRLPGIISNKTMMILCVIIGIIGCLVLYYSRRSSKHF